jgi:hypothetical protein
MRSSHLLSGTVLLLAVAAACHVDDLVDDPPTAMIIPSPTAVQVTAATGSSAARQVAIALRTAHNDAMGWQVERTGTGAWLQLEGRSGTTPDTLHLTIDPAAATGARSVDTLIITPDDPDGAPTRVPVTLLLEECGTGTFGSGATVTDSLRNSDCASTHRPGRPARRYRLSGAAGDSVSLHLTSTTLPVVLIVDTSDAPGATPFAESSTCGGAAGACLRYLRIPAGETALVEVTTSGDGSGVGPFTLTRSAPRPPTEPDSLRQARRDSVTAVSPGAAVPEPEVVIRGIVRDPDLGDTLRLEVELQPVGTSFTSEATTRSAPTPAGNVAYARVTGLADGGGYHWRWRTLDQTGRATEWRSFGDNPESSPDLRVAIAADRLQFRQGPTTTAAGAAITPALEVVAVDGEGAVVPSFTGTITLALGSGPAGATLSGERSRSAVAGVATFPGLSLDRAGTGYTLVASSPEMIDATSAAFAITAGPATRLSFSRQPSTASPGAPITPAVEVTAFDGYGNVATTFTGEVTIALGHDGSLLQDATLGGTRIRSAAAGVARFTDLSLDRIGSGYTLVATATGLTSITSEGFSIVPLAGSPTEQRFGQQPSAARAGEVVAPAVTILILDGRGERVTDYAEPVTVTLSGGTAGALLAGTTTAVASGGVARFGDLRVDRAGSSYQLRASTGSLPDVTSLPFDISPAPPTTGALTVTASTSGAELDPNGYTVTVAGESRALAVDGATTFTGIAAGTQSVALSGVAANCTVAGENPREVTVPAGGTATTTFAVNCTATPPPPAATRLSFTAQPPSVMVVGSGFGVSVAGLSDQGSVVPTYSGPVSLTLIGALPGVSLTGNTSTNAVNGIATFSGLSISGTCLACQLLASAPGLSGATSAVFIVVLPGLAR